MKILCVYDPSLILVPYERGVSFHDAVVAFEEHNVAQAFFGFKVALSETIENMLVNLDSATYVTGEVILNSVLQSLVNSRGQFHFVPECSEVPFNVEQGEPLFADYVAPEIATLWNELLGHCFEVGLDRCYASWSAENGTRHPSHYRDTQSRRLGVVRDLYEWGEAYRQVRKHPACLLPNAFLALSTTHTVFAFCPPIDLMEDDTDLPRPRLPRDMAERGQWREVGGNRRGYQDRWGNYWMWNQNRGHWDVQITEYTKRAIGAGDYHINVECAERRALSNNSDLSGHIIEGGGELEPVFMHQFSIWHYLDR